MLKDLNCLNGWINSDHLVIVNFLNSKIDLKRKLLKKLELLKKNSKIILKSRIIEKTRKIIEKANNEKKS